MADLIYIGVLAPMDTDENNNTNENPAAVQGSYDATQMQVVSVSISDNFDPGITYNDDFFMIPDTFTYDIGGGPITSGLDSEARFLAEVIRAGTTTPESIEISVYQLQNGATFVRLPDGYKINSLTIQSMVQDGYDAIFTDSSSTSSVVCYAAGTWIETPEGLRPIEDLRIGDLVTTVDHGDQPVRWASRWRVPVTETTRSIRIAAGALGQAMPFAPLIVSRQHRLYVNSPVARHMFGSDGALIAAHRLVGWPGITYDTRQKICDYVHVMCARHELILANGVLAETLLNAPGTRTVLAQQSDLCFPADLARTPARPLINPRRQKSYVARIMARQTRGHERQTVPPGQTAFRAKPQDHSRQALHL